MSNKIKYYYHISLVILLIVIPIVLLLLPATYFDSGQSLCLSKLFVEKECYACGMTRAIMHLIHFDFEDAYAYNMLSFIVFPLLCVIWVQWFLKELKICRILKKMIGDREKAAADVRGQELEKLI